MPLHDPVAAFLDRLIEGQRRASNYVQIESEADTKVVGRTGYRLIGANRLAVEGKSEEILSEAAERGGWGQFTRAGRIDGGLYGALGETIVPATTMQAAE